MYALVAWTTKNGVSLEREALEVVSNTKLTIMNGGKMEPGATVNMLFKREIWGSMVQSIHGMYCYYICFFVWASVILNLYHKHSRKGIFIVSKLNETLLLKFCARQHIAR